MKNALLVTFFISSVVTKSYCQGLTHSAEGKSSIPIKGTVVGIDIATTELSFGYNNIDRVIETKKIKPLFGVEVKVKNEEGIGNLLSTGDWVPSGNGTLYGGFTLSNLFKKSEIAELDATTNLNKKFLEKQKKFRMELQSDFKIYYQAVIKSTNLSPAQKLAIDAILTADLTSASGKEETFYDAFKNRTSVIPEELSIYNTVSLYAKKRQAEFAELKEKHQESKEKLHNAFRDRSYQRLTVFGFGGLTTIGFKKFNIIDSAAFAKSFTDVNDRGNNIGLGINYQVRNLWIGVTYSMAIADNFSTLSKKDYTMRNTTTLNSQSLIEEKKITAYTGKYGQTKVNYINSDFVMRFNLDKKYKSSLLVNPYIRASVASRDTSLLINKTNLGLGFYFLQGKFLGGFYTEVPDVNNNTEKKKPIGEQDLKPYFRRLTFGIVTKFNISSIMGW